MNIYKVALPVFAITLLPAALTTQPAHAKITCLKGYQAVKGHGHLATPYCQDAYLATVAREFGMRISARSIRNNPSKKQEVCALVGFDNRIKDVCTGYLPEDNGTGR